MDVNDGPTELERYKTLAAELVTLAEHHAGCYVSPAQLVPTLTELLGDREKREKRLRAHYDAELAKEREAAVDTGWPDVAAWAYTVLVHRVSTSDEVGQLALESLKRASDAVGVLDDAYSERVRLMNELSNASAELRDMRQDLERLKALPESPA